VWLGEAFPELRVHVVAGFWQLAEPAQEAIVRTLLGGRAPDVRYGPLAADRAVVDDPVAHWSHLLAPARAALCRRICLVGAESTGKTTLARLLAERHGTEWVREFGRDYTVDKIAAGTNDQWDTRDFVTIAETQQHIEDETARRSGPLLFCDTDAFATAVWHERYTGRRSAEVEAIGRRRHYDLYVLTGTDAPYEPDGVREGWEIREWMHRRFAEQLALRPEPWMLVTGTVAARMTAIDARIDALGLLRAESILDPRRFAAARR
jgi:NadR type nicotinamide-nucleotide adenylyltransferase